MTLKIVCHDPDYIRFVLRKFYNSPHDYLKAMDDIEVVMTPFWDVTVILVANSYVFGFLRLKILNTKSRPFRSILQSS